MLNHVEWNQNTLIMIPMFSRACTYRRSISERISSILVSPCVIFRYLCTQATRWSLNAPLINWCRMSGDMSAWISALGKSFVKGCGRNE